MNVVNPEVLAELDLSMVIIMLLSLLGAVILMLLACAVARAGAEPVALQMLVPAIVGRVLPGAVLPPRKLARACGTSRAPPCTPPDLHAAFLRIRDRR